MDIISFNEAATANDRIGRFNANPDSDSGLVSLPKKIDVGENVTIPDGRVVVHPNLEIDGTLTIEDGGELFVPFGGTLVSSDLVHPVDTIADLRNVTGKYKYVYVTGYHTKNDGAFGSHIFRLKGVKTTETDNGGTIIIATIGGTDYVYELQFSGAVNVKWFGGNIQAALDEYTHIENNSNVYISSSLKLRSSITIFGGGSITSTNASVPIFENNTGGTISGVTIKDITLFGINNTIGMDLNIFALSYIENVSVYNCKIGVKASDMWQCNLTSVVVRNTNYTGDIGFDIADGTSTSFNRCWSKKNNIGYSLGNLKYSSLVSCACDTFTQFAYRGGQSITFLSCGAEDGIIISGGSVFDFGARPITIVGGQLLSISSTAPNGEVCIFRCNGTQLDILGVRAENAIGGTNIDGINASNGARVEMKNSLLSKLNSNVVTSGAYTRVAISNAGSKIMYGGTYDFSEMPTISTTPIIASGSNANGTYIKYADGTLICKNVIISGADCTTATTILGLSGFTTASPLTWTFPFAFVDNPSCSFMATRSDRATSIFFTNAYTTSSVFSGINMLCSSSMTAAFAPNIHCIAIGKWK